MKKLLSVATVLALTVIMMDANAQFSYYPGSNKTIYQPINGNPLDAVRQRYQSASQGMRGGNTNIFIDYATSNGDDTTFASILNMRFSASGNNYVVVAYNTLHDQVSDVGYNYSDFDSIAIDSLFIPFGHERNTTGTDTMIVKIIQLNSTGYPTNMVLWSQTLTASGNSTLSGQSDWFDFVLLPLAPAITLPSTTKFGVRVEYYGAPQDTFGYLYSFVDLGSCPGEGTSFHADFSAFWPNSYRFDVFNNQLLPTPAPNYGDVYWDCDGDTIPEANPVQNINYLVAARGIQASGGPVGCDTLSNVSSIGPAGFGVYPDINSGGGGYISGHNGFGDISKADFFTNNYPINMEVTGSFYLFDVADYGSPSSSITAAVWDNSGAGGSPGNIIASETILISAIAQNIADTLPTYIQFNPPAQVSSDFYVGITFGYGAGDTVAIFTDTIGSNTPTGWEEWGPALGGGWYPYSSPSSWFGGIDIAHVIFPIICTPSQQCPTISVSTTPTSSTCISSNGTATASATGGNGPYTYEWSNGQTGATATGLAPGTYTITATDADSCYGVGNVTITAAIANLAVNVTTGANTSCSTPNGTASAAVTNGTAPYNYAWSNGGATQNISGLATNTYSVSVYDANGCLGTGSGVVGNNLPVITVNTSTNPNSQCLNPNGSATAAGSGGTVPYSYQWDAAAGSQATATATNLSGGTYSVTATDGSGCTGSGDATVGSNTPNIAINVVTSIPNSACGTPNGSATVSANGGTPGYTYAWDNGQTGPTLSNAGGGDYDVTATDANGCTGDTIVTISSTTPVITVNVSTTTNTHCVNPNGSASANASGGSGTFTTYQWGSGQSGANISGLTAGNYSVVVTDDNGCTGTGSGTVLNNLPSFTILVTPTPVTSCTSPNGTASATVNPPLSVTYVWNTVPQQTGPNATSLSVGSYQVTATDPTSGCTATAATSINPPPAVFVNITSSNHVTNCSSPNGSATALASGGAGGFTYSWSNGQTNATATDLDAGSYTVIATDANGCTGTNSVTINDITVPVSVTVSVNNDVTSCANPNGSVLALANPPGQYTYSWSNGGTSASLNNLDANTYTVTVTDNNQCSAVGSATVGTSLNLPTVTASSTNETAANANDGTASATASGGTPNYTYSWSNGGSTPIITGLDAGTYTVVITDQAGCSASASATVQTDVGIGDLNDLHNLTLSPNPTKDVVNLKLELKEANEVSVSWHNVLGEKLIEFEDIRIKSLDKNFDLSSLPQGIYLVRIKIGNDEITRRVSVMR